MAGKKGRKRGPSKFVKFAARALNETLNVQVSDMLQAVMTAASEKKSAEEISAILRAKLIGCVQTWVDEDFFDKAVFKLVGVNVTVTDTDDNNDDDDEEDDDE